MDSIHLRGCVTAATFTALQRISKEHSWPDFYEWAEPETLAWFSFRLQHVADKEENFPLGKWATIQRLQAVLSEHAELDVCGSIKKTQKPQEPERWEEL